MSTTGSLAQLEAFVTAAQASSFSGAARVLGISPVAVGKSVAKLESALGVRLFHRTTRALHLTEDGRRLFDSVVGSFTDLLAALRSTAQGTHEVPGPLRVSVSRIFGREYLLPLLKGFRRDHPLVRIELSFEQRPVDLVREGVDVGIGAGFTLGADVIARELGPLHSVFVADPESAARLSRLPGPWALLPSDVIAWRSARTGRMPKWVFQGPRGRQVDFSFPEGALLELNDAPSALEAVAAGQGVTIVALGEALPLIDQGRVVRLFPSWYADLGAVRIYYRGPRKLVAPRVRAFVDHVVADFERHRLAERCRGDR